MEKYNSKALIEAINKKFGKNTIVDKDDLPPVNVVSSGSLKVDIAVGRGGFPRGRLSEISGNESSGKTTLALQLAAMVQSLGEGVLYIDSENALDVGYCRNLGLDVDDSSFMLTQPDDAETGLQIIQDVITDPKITPPGIIIYDSIAASPTKAELAGEMEDQHMGVKARLLSKGLAKIIGPLAKTPTILIFINQLRDTINGGYGPSSTTPGGRAIKFYSTIRVEMTRSTQVKDGDTSTGNLVNFKVTKNKIAPPNTKAILEVEYGLGFTKEAEVFSLGVEHGIIEKTGAWFTVAGERLQGQANAKEFLQCNPQVTADLEAKIRKIYNLP